MKRIIRFITIAAAACVGMFVLAGCSSAKYTAEIGFESGYVIVDGNQMTVDLAANPSTGYQWSFVSDGAEVAVVDQGYAEGTQGDSVGAGGIQSYAVSPVKDGTGNLTFTFARNFEAGSAAETVTINYTVQDGAFTSVNVAHEAVAVVA